VATRDGLSIAGTPYQGIDGRNPIGPRTLLNNPMIEAAVVEVDAESIVESGLGFDVCDVVVIRSLSGMTTPFGRPVEAVLLDALDPAGVAVLDAGDPAVRALAADTGGPAIFINGGDQAARPSLGNSGHRAVTVRQTPAETILTIGSHEARGEAVTIRLPDAQADGAAPPASLVAVQAAFAAATALQIPAATIQHGLQALIGEDASVSNPG
jgi:cyanophycin synthetase